MKVNEKLKCCRMEGKGVINVSLWLWMQMRKSYNLESIINHNNFVIKLAIFLYEHFNKIVLSIAKSLKSIIYKTFSLPHGAV